MKSNRLQAALLSMAILFISIPSFSQWTQLPQDTNNYNCSVFFINPDTGFISGDLNGSHGLIQRTTDGGQTWTSTTLVNILLCMNIEFPTDSIGYCQGQTSLMYKTTDVGTTWNITGSIASNTDISAMHFLNADTGFALGFDGKIFRTTDGSVSWTCVSNLALSFQNYYPGTGKFQFVNDSIGFVASGNYGSVMKTVDGGTTWNYINLPTSNNTWALSMYMFNKDTGLVVGEAGRTWKTVNGGLTWMSPQVISPYDLMDVMFFNDTLGFIVGGENDNIVYHPPAYPPVGGRIFVTTDGGLTWSTDLSLGNNWLTSICNAGNNIAYAAGWHGWLYKNDNVLSLASVHENGVSIPITVFPDPASDRINLPLAQHVELFDVNANQILSGENISEINVSELPDGIYLLRLEKSGVMYSQKVIISR